MNILKYPEEALPGAVLSKKEFEESAIDAHMVDDLMDRDDLEEGEFLREAIYRANARRTPQNLRQWVASPNNESVFLVDTPLVRPLLTLLSLHRAQQKQIDITRQVIIDLLNAGSRS